MWQNLSILHCKPDSLSNDGLLWKTCLRQIQFLPPGTEKGRVVSFGEYYKGIELHRFLVEICCGLHSPLLGETEVFGQFRNFRIEQKWPKQWIPFLDAIEEDVKKIRRNYLLHLGTQSYGSLARKYLQNKTTLIIGGGQLAEEIIPWLEGEKLQFVRDPLKIKVHENVKLFSLQEESKIPLNAQWIIAAPLTNIELTKLWTNKEPALVLDFRGEEKFQELLFPYKPLSQLFQELESVRTILKEKKEQARKAIQELSIRRESEIQHRPYGWEDVFA
ncbi:MAG: hypothetical protein M9962_07830 [Oligoflexia bacterium]|nr:hypothetical protein [Oligoflexia bacterium]